MKDVIKRQPRLALLSQAGGNKTLGPIETFLHPSVELYPAKTENPLDFTSALSTFFIICLCFY